MARCANCGTEISGGDKTRLCDKCKRIILPFVKLTDVSTSSAVRRLTANERNLRSAGVTDTGMEYLYRICEINDRRRLAEKEAKEAAKSAYAAPAVPQQDALPAEEEEREISRPEPNEGSAAPVPRRRTYGTFLTAALVILIASGVAGIAWFVLRLVWENAVDAAPVIASVGSFAAAYAAYVLKKALEDLDEIKKRLR